MSILVAEQELYRSCRILFGNELEVGGDFLNYLRHSGLKKAYRLKARQTHPDLAVANQTGVEGGCVNDFITVQQAYENLCGYLERRDLGSRFSAAAATAHPGFAPGAQWRSAAEQFRQRAGRQAERPDTRSGQNPGAGNLYTQLYCGPVPPIRMRLGNFLYYSGLIDWMTVVKALLWQRAQRPRLGELAQRLGWLTEEEIREVLANREYLEKFGASAVRRQSLTEKQLQVLIGYQKLLQKKFGAFFLEQQFFTRAQLEEQVRRHIAHNAACGSPR
ncbi:MAG: J domain-containing protein [Desulfobulbaceae bacterium]|nr:J domain-containing protein [Desulfobulbaceae bacterium]